MGISPFEKICNSTVDITAKQYERFIAESEQLRVLKNYCKLEDVITKSEILTLIKAMEVNNE